MVTLAYARYKVKIDADGEERSEIIYAAGKRQAGAAASKAVQIRTGAKNIKIKRITVVVPVTG